MPHNILDWADVDSTHHESEHEWNRPFTDHSAPRGSWTNRLPQVDQSSPPSRVRRAPIHLDMVSWVRLVAELERSVRQMAVDTKFKSLAAEWRKSLPSFSSAHRMAMQPMYLRIIGLGPDVLPSLLRELEREPDHWFFALGALTGQNPIKPASRGKLTEMAKDWLEWAKANGHKW